MNIWEVISVIATGLSGFFIYDLIREFKTFKKEVKVDVDSLKKERADFIFNIRNIEHTFKNKILELEKLHNDYSLKLSENIIRMDQELKFTTQVCERNRLAIGKGQEILKLINARQQAQGEQLKSVKIVLGKITMIKTQK